MCILLHSVLDLSEKFGIADTAYFYVLFLRWTGVGFVNGMEFLTHKSSVFVFIFE